MGFRSLREAIDTTTPGGRLVFHLFGALAEFEREIIRDRTMSGLAAARARGRVGGRPSKLSADQQAMARRLYEERVHTVEEIGALLGVSRTSVYRSLNRDTTASGLPLPAPAAATAVARRARRPAPRGAEPAGSPGPGAG